jgi:chromate transporter
LITKVRYYIYLKDVLVLALSAFGGPQAHIAMLFDLMVDKRGYLTEEDLVELNALCQILPGPTSTQTITAIGYRIGGANLAYLTLLIWIIPAVTLMTTAGILISTLSANNISIEFTKYIQPMAVGFVSYAAYKISTKVVNTYTGIVIMVFSAVASYFFSSPYIFPLILVVAGSFTALKYKQHEKEENIKINIKWANFFLWGGTLIFAAILGGVTDFLPVRLFENFYRNGSLIFGGGQVLIPLLYTEFVEFKDYLTSEQFLTGYAFVQSVPGPVFSFSAYIGAIANNQHGIWGGILGGFASALGVFLPGTFLIFFIIKIWDGLKKYRVIKASLEGVNAASSGMVAAAAILMFQPIDISIVNISIVIMTMMLLLFTKIPAPFIILCGLAAGFIF